VPNTYLLVSGSDGVNARPLLTDATGKLTVAISGSTAILLSDTLSNPTTASFGAYMLGYDSSTGQWVRPRMDVNHFMSVNLGTALDHTIDSITAYPFSKTSVASFQFTCTNPATVLTTAAAKDVTITALAANVAPVYVGGVVGTTAANGHELVQSASYSNDIDNSNRFFCFSTAGTQKISVLVTN
jgi:hypothetical protein